MPVNSWKNRASSELLSQDKKAHFGALKLEFISKYLCMLLCEKLSFAGCPDKKTFVVIK